MNKNQTLLRELLVVLLSLEKVFLDLEKDVLYISGLRL